MSPSARALFTAKRDRLHRQTDRMFLWLLLVQWIVAIVLALALTPWSYAGPVRSIHFHVKAAIGFGALLNSLPVALIYLRPGWWGTRHVIAFSQMMWSALLIMITGGRIETHFHIFGSLAFLAFYADWRILVTATVTVAGDHLFRGLFWPDSVYGLANPEWWRFVEHATWVAFEDLVLVFGCYRTIHELRVVATHEALLEETNALIEHRVEERTTELAESMERFRALVENSDAIPFEYDSEAYRIVYIAPQIARLLEADPSALDDRLFATALHPDDRTRVRETIRAFARGTALPGEPIDSRMVTTTGRVRHVRMLLSDRLAGPRVRGIILDVTRQRLLEDELRQAQKLESVGRLAAGVAHEINTPIQFVSDSVQFARDAIVDLVAITDKYRAASDGILDGTAGSSARATAAATAASDGDLAYIVEQIPKALDRALEGTSRVATIVRSMKSFAHRDRAAAERIDLNEAVLSTLTVARGEYKYIAELELDCHPIPPVTCWIGEINQVVLNLVVNAAHAIKHKHGDSGVLGVIKVSTRCEDDRVTISITDSGTGIPDAVREHLFEPFFTTKPVGEGSGQGLALARAIVVDKHHGSLTFDTALGEGSTFHLCIPVQQPIAAESAA
ncbi:MAG: PAS domain S-box protein [Myxococcales bacterium]|nr:PAS domain S-box protein [Myxococcales bacterium]